ncbi:MAG TPA: AAA family ATPase [Clostridia bacterium]|nr:AAA family ATPase [Clostridia bacterium]
MKIKRLYIGDFGILRNQTLEEINPGIVVIGGLNRAGKSTFMEVLRYLGYGFPKGRGLPPPSSKYEAEADISLDTGDIYNLRISGHGDPAIKRILGDGEEITHAKELYGLDNFTYGQLFTITLDELQKNHNISGQDKRRLQSILLGAGFKDMLIIPQLQQDFYKEGDKIGGKRGSPKVKQFKPYYQSIDKGLKVKVKAFSQVDEYQNKQGELREKDRASETIEKEIEELKSEKVQLDVIKNNYSIYLEMKRLEEELYICKGQGWEKVMTENDLDSIISLKEEYGLLNKEYENKSIELGIHSSLRERLIKSKGKIADFMSDISGVGERIRQYGLGVNEYNRRKRDVVARVKDTNSIWDEGDMKEVAHIELDHIKYNSLLQMVERHRDLDFQLINHVDTLNRLEDEYNILKDRGKGEDDIKPWMGMKGYFYSSIALILLGVVLSFINPLLGGLFGFGGIVATAVYYILGALDSKGASNNSNDSLEYKLLDIDAEERKIDDLTSEIDTITRELDGYKDVLGISQVTSYNVLPGYFHRIKDIQTSLWDLDEMSHEIKDNRSSIEERFDQYADFINQLSGEDVYGLDDKYEDLEKEWNRIVLALKEWAEVLVKAQEIKTLEQRIHAIETRLVNIMDKYEPIEEELDYANFLNTIETLIEKGQESIEGKRLEDDLETANKTISYAMASDGVRKAFNLFKGVNFIDAFKEKCIEYSSEEESREAYSTLSMELEEKHHNLDTLKDNRQRLEDDLKRLATVENLTQGQRQIDNGRADLKVLADQYAINMIASFLLKEAGNSLLEGMKDSIMDSAGNIFKNMTGGHYKGILPSEPLLESDFEAILHGKSSPETIEMLSRGTREQLYLSVRLSRIMDIKPNLPIIIDDSFANFDSLHLGQSISILSELSKTHQIFVLTCHGKLVERIAEAECGAQYWKLEEGRLGASEFDELMGHLN